MSNNVVRQAGTRLAGEEILANAKAIAGQIRERDLARDYDEARQLPVDVVDSLRDAGVFRMNMPAAWGGPEMTSMQQVEVIEALSRADASVGWCSFIWCDSGLYSGYLEDEVARKMYPRLDMATSGWIYPVGQAHRVDGGYRVSGQWMFGSGSNHCDLLAGGCLVFDNGEPQLGPNGMPDWRVMLAPRDAYEIEDTWYTTGLRGTGSNDYHTEDLFVPAEHSFSFFDPPRREGPLWVRPDSLLRKMSGVPLGVAGDAIDTAIEMLEGKVDRIVGLPYRDMPRVQTAIAESRILLASARSYVFSSLEKYWIRLEAHEEPTVEERADVWLSRTNAFQSARRVVGLLYDTIGGSAVYANSGPFDRHLRDMQTACQHIAGQTKGYELIGSLLLGKEPEGPGLL